VPASIDLHGVWIPLITPFDASGAVDLAAIERLCHEYLDAGAAGITALGTTGESPALDAAEKQAVVEACSRACASRGAPLMVGTGTNSTRTTIAATTALAGTPALHSALVVVPYYVRPSEAGIVGHFQAVAAASPVPIVVYNIPYRTGRGLGAKAILELAHTPNIAGIKQSVGALDGDTLEVLRDAPSGFQVLCGEDSYILPMVLMGGHGAIAAAAHVCTERFVAMVQCGLTGKVDDGRRHADALLAVVQAGFAEPNPAVWKAVLHAQGRIATPDVRAPMTNASRAATDACLDAIAAASH
jgi:4-hydroxy-tetrahydrodipicolinate synthase